MMRGVFARILLWFWLSLVLVALALELTIAATSTPVEIRVQRFSDGALGSRAREAVAILDRDGPPKVARFLEGLERTTRMHAVLLDADGHDVAGHPVPRKAAAVAARALATGETEMDTDGQAAVKARAVTIGGERRYVLVATLPVGLMRLVHDGPTAQALRLLAVLVTAAAACYGLARYVTRPLAVLRSTTHTLARGDLSVRVGSTMGRRTDEFAELGRDFDRMAERLETLVTAERRLLRDISHELRSPLARLNVALGVARQHAGDDQAVLDRIEREADRLNTLIGQLLMLARLESGTLTPERVVVDLEAIVRDVAEDAAFEAQGRGRRVQIVETPCATRRRPPAWRSGCAARDVGDRRASASPCAITAAACRRRPCPTSSSPSTAWATRVRATPAASGSDSPSSIAPSACTAAPSAPPTRRTAGSSSS